MTTGRTIALTRWTFVGKVMSLLFNMLSRLVIAFLPRNKRFLSSSEKTAPRRQEGKLGYIPVCKEGSRQSENQRSGIRLRNLAFCVWEDASFWAHWIHSFHMHFSYGVNPILLLLALPQLLSSHHGGGIIHWITVLGALINIWRPEITDGCDVSYLLI